MSRRRTKKQSLSKKIIKTLDIPEDIVFNTLRMTMMSNTEIRIENYKSILEYEADKITLSAKNLIIELCGDNLNIKIITDDEISVLGDIFSVNFSHSRS